MPARARTPPLVPPERVNARRGYGLCARTHTITPLHDNGRSKKRPTAVAKNVSSGTDTTSGQAAKTTPSERGQQKEIVMGKTALRTSPFDAFLGEKDGDGRKSTPAEGVDSGSLGSLGGPRGARVLAAVVGYLKGRKTRGKRARRVPDSVPLVPQGSGKGRFHGDTVGRSSPTMTPGAGAVAVAPFAERAKRTPLSMPLTAAVAVGGARKGKTPQAPDLYI